MFYGLASPRIRCVPLAVFGFCNQSVIGIGTSGSRSLQRSRKTPKTIISQEGTEIWLGLGAIETNVRRLNA